MKNNMYNRLEPQRHPLTQQQIFWHVCKISRALYWIFLQVIGINCILFIPKPSLQHFSKTIVLFCLLPIINSIFTAIFVENLSNIDLFSHDISLRFSFANLNKIFRTLAYSDVFKCAVSNSWQHLQRT